VSRGALAAVLLILAAAGASGQQAVSSATLSGRVQDSSGGVLAGAEARLTNTGTNQRFTATTDGRGRFRFARVPVGPYVLAVSKEGFVPVQQAITAAAGQALEIPVTLSSLAATESVSVSSAAPVVENVRTEVAETITPAEIQNLPLNGRNYLDLALLSPGVSRTNTGANQTFAETSAVPGTGISVSSQRNLNNSFIVDGLSANDDAAELAGTFYSQDVIREFQVVRSGGIAEYGRSSAGVVNIVTQSGTNAVHGDGYGFFRDDRFDGKNALAATKFPFSRQQYGLSLGGPVVRDQTFFYANVERLRQRSSTVITIDPASVPVINARLDAAGTGGARIAAGNLPTSLDTANGFARVDHGLSGAAQISLRYSIYDVSSDNARNTGGLNDASRATGLSDRDQTLAASAVWSLSSRVLNEARAQATRSRLSAPPNDSTGPAVNIAGTASWGTATFSPTERDIDMAEVVDTVTVERGAHSFKGGADYLYDRARIAFPGALQGVYSFTNLANFLAGRYSSFQQAFGNPETTQHNPNFGVFVQDEWRVTPRLVVNLGLRYDVQVLPSPVRTDSDNLAPRLGIAWDPQANGKSVVRASFGIFYNRVPLRALANALQRDGVTYRIAQVTPTSPTTPAPPVFPGVFASFPSGVLTNVNSVNPDIQSGDSLEASLQYERALGSASSFSIGYEHLRGRHIIMQRNVNAPTTTDPSVPNLGRPNPSYANNSRYDSIGDSWYDGLSVTFTRRPVSWGSVRIAYTYSKAFDTAGNFFFSTPQDNNDIPAERGRSDNDQRHRLSVSGTLSSPARGGGSFWSELARGWLFSGIFTYTSPLPFNTQLPNDRNGDTNFNDRPAGVARNAGQGFDYRSLDLRVSRTFPLGRGLTLEAILEGFNVLNRKNYQVPNNIVGSPTYGQPTAVNDPRQLQFGARLIF
jgi:hypothetical protein